MSAVAQEIGQNEVGISVVTLVELSHGAARADSAERKSKREEFIEELLVAMPVYLLTAPIALRAGQLDGQNQARGVRVPLADLLIGVTALELGYGIATANVRHFQQIPGLSISQI